MTTAHYRAWKFTDPDPQVVGKAAGLTISNRGGIETIEGKAAVRQAIFALLATRPGERVMRPNYGCNLHRLVFSPNDDTTAGLAIHYVRQAIERWEPRVEIIRLDSSRSQAMAGLMELYLEYRVRVTLQTERLTYAFDLTGGLL